MTTPYHARNFAPELTRQHGPDGVDRLSLVLFDACSTRDLEYDLIYVNGDNNLDNLRRDNQTRKVRLIEDEFQRLMFAVEDV